jgi:ATP-dependent DNA helicase PIF1
VETADVLVRKIRYNAKAMLRWTKVKVLVIDEGIAFLFSFLFILKLLCFLVSMLDAGLFDKLAHIACVVRKSSEPFGGIQVLFVMFQKLFAMTFIL